MRPDDPTEAQHVPRRDTMVGPYRLLELVGQGAMGEVWRAEQSTPVRRIVALKLIKKGMDTREVVTRFEIERQALALMDHPGIATVYDAGEAPDGRPYIAMEYVAGEPITEYCESHRLSIEERLELFQRVCFAVQHAHQKAVIHRDLKPSNILVVERDGRPAPKIIDFGIAKATAQRLTDRSAATLVGQLIGTPLYMSPEQVAMTAAGVDTRADVYSLGVILYELLSGTLPHDADELAAAGYEGVLKILRDAEAPRPSTRVSTLGDRSAEVAAQRGLDPKRLLGKLRGDLDWIAMKALEKDRKRRYESPKELAEDLQRFMTFDVVTARPPSAWYRTSRFVRRHGSLVATASVVVVALVAIAVLQTIQARVIAAERNRAVAYELLSHAREQVDEDPTAAMAYALASLRSAPLPETDDLIRRAMAHGPPRVKLPRTREMGKNSICLDISPDGRFSAAGWGNTDRSVVLHDLTTGRWRWLRPEDEGRYEMTHLYWGWWDAAFGSDSATLTAIGGAGLVSWELATGRQMVHIGHEALELPGFSRVHQQDERDVVVLHAVEDGRTKWLRFDARTGDLDELGFTLGLDDDGNGDKAPAVSRDGLWFADFAGRSVLLQSLEDLGTETVTRLDAHGARVTSVAFSADRRLLASVDVEGEVVAWDLTSTPPRRIRQFRTTEPTLAQDPELVFDPHRYRFLKVWSSKFATLFDLTPGPPRSPRPLLDRTHWTHGGGFLPDGSIITARNGGLGTARFTDDPWIAWSLGRVSPSEGIVVAFPSDDGRSLFAWTDNGRILRFAIADDGWHEPEEIGRSEPVNPAMGHGIAPDFEMQHFLTTQEGRVRLFDRRSGEMTVVEGIPQDMGFLSLGPEGRRILGIGERVAEPDRYRAVVFDAASLERTHEFDIDVVGLSVFGTEVNQIQIPVFGPEGVTELGDRSIVRRKLLDTGAVTADTLWTSPAAVRGVVEEDASAAILVRDRRLLLVDLTQGRDVDLGPATFPIGWADYSRENGLVVTGATFSDVALVIDVESGKRWRLPRSDRMAFDAIDPLGRWIAVGGDAWRLPLDPGLAVGSERDKIDYLERMTNLRARLQEESSPRYRIEALPEDVWSTAWPSRPDVRRTGSGR